MKRYVDDISVLAIEQRLVQKLPSLFTPENVFNLAPEEIARLAAETGEAAAERGRCEEKLDVLTAALLDLKRLDKHGSVSAGK